MSVILPGAGVQPDPAARALVAVAAEATERFSDDELEAAALWAAAASALDERIRARRERIETEFVDLGRDLMVMRDRDLFRALDCETFEQYLARPEVSFSRATAYILIAAVDVIDQLGLPLATAAEIGHVKLSMLRAPITQGVGEPADWVASARTLSRADLRREIRDRGVRGPISSSDEERAEDATIAKTFQAAIEKGVIGVAFDRWKGLVILCHSATAIKVRGAGDAPIRIEIEAPQ